MKKTTIMFAAFLFSAALCHAQGADGMEKERDYINYPYWIDEVTEQPTGYVIDVNGNVEISTVEGLAWLPSVVNGLNGCIPDDFNGRTVRLTNDIDFEAVAKLRFTPIGSREHPFKGTFDGGGHTLDGLYIGLNQGGISDEETNLDFGFFGYICHGIVKDITINSGGLANRHLVFGPDYEQYYDGGMVGFADSLSLVDGCIVKIFVSSSGMDVNNLGGVVGLNRNSTIRNCAYVYGNHAMGAGDRAGGIVFKNLSEGGYADAEICNCFYYGYFLECLGGAYALGGVACFNETDPKSQTGGYKAVVKNCFAESISVLRATYDGSIVGKNMEGCLVENCYGHIWNNYENAGLFGFTLGNIAECAEFLPTGPCQLETSVLAGGTSTDIMVDALNAWVDAQENPSIYKHWVPVYEPYDIPMFEDGILSVGENGTKASTTDVYPNPGKDVLNIRTALQNAHVEIYDLSGKLIFNHEITGSITSINTENWPAGVYIWKVYTNQAGPSTLRWASGTAGSGTLVETGKWVKE